MEGSSNYSDLIDSEAKLYDIILSLEESSDWYSGGSEEKSGSVSAEDGARCGLPQSELSIESPQFQQTEQQKVAFKISFEKLSKIYDSDECLCRWVMLRNTCRRLQCETVNATIERKLLADYSNGNSHCLQNDYLLSDNRSYDDSHCTKSDDAVVPESDFDPNLGELNKFTPEDYEALERIIESHMGSLIQGAEKVTSETERFASVKRWLSDMNCDSPTMLATSNNDADQSTPKKIRTDSPSSDDSL